MNVLAGLNESLESTLEKCQLRENKLPIECGQRDFAFLRVNALSVDDSDSIPLQPYGMRMFYGVCGTFITILRKYLQEEKTFTSREWFRSCGTPNTIFSIFEHNFQYFYETYNVEMIS